MMPNYPTADAQGAPQRPPGAFDISRILAIVRRRAPIFIAVTVVIAAIVTLVAVQATPMYQATASVAIDPKQRDLIDLQAAAAGGQADSNSIDTEVQILSSRAIAAQVAERQGLHLDPAFTGLANARPGVGEMLRNPGSLLKAARPASTEAPPQSSTTTLDRAIDWLMGSTTIRRSGLTYVINITVQSADPAKAARLANSYARVYLDTQVTTRNDLVATSSTTLSSRLTQLRADAEAADAAVQQYKIRNNLISALGSTSAEQDVSFLNQQIATAQADLSEKQARLTTARNQLRAGGGGGNVSAALNSDTVRQLRAQEAEANRNLAQMTQRYGELWPGLPLARQQLASAQQQIQTEINRIISNLESEVEVSEQRLASLRGNLTAARGSLVSNNSAMAGLVQLQSRADTARATYEAFQTRADQTAAQEGGAQANARIISAAQVPSSPSSPQVKLALVFGMAAGMMAGLMVVALLELFANGIDTGGELERRFGVPYAGGVPLFKSTVKGRARQSRPEVYLVSKPFSAFAESLRALRTFLMRPAPNAAAPKVIAIVSSLPREGKSLTAFSLARTMAMAGSKVVLIDCDIRRRGASSLGVKAEAGLLEVLSGAAPLEKALIKDNLTDAWLLPALNGPDSAHDPFTTENMDKLIKVLASRFDFVLLDTAPVLAVAETRELAAKADGVLMLARWRRTPAKAIDLAIDMMLDSGANLLGVALTQVDLRHQSQFGYGDRYYYYKTYKNYYSG